jgi:VWFA-related protein
MRKFCSVIVSSLVIIPLLTVKPQCQAAGQQDKSDALKIRSTEVFVDAVVSDRKNRLIGDLAQHDFEVFEDGVRQEITSFRVVRGAPKTSSQPALERKSTDTPAAEPKSGPADYIPPNITIVLLDYSTTRHENQKLIQEASIKYVEQRLQPNDVMAVFVLGSGLQLAAEFTSDKTRLIAALKKTDLAGSAMAYDRASLNANIEAGQSPQVQFQENPIGATPSGQNAASQAADLSNRLQSLGTAIIAQHVGSLDLALRSSLDRRQSLGVLSAIRAIAMGVKGIPGRKTMMLFSEGFFVGPSVEDELHAVVGLANRSQLAIYCIESQGLETRELKGELVPRDALTSAISNPADNKIPRGGETGFDRARQAGQDIPDSVLRYVANSTGGFLIRNTNDLSIGLDRVEEETRSYYLLAYRPKNEKLDGKYRQIKVSLRKPELVVRARDGYYAMPAGSELLTPGEFQLAELARKTDPSAKIPIFVRVGGFQDASSRYRVPVILEIPTQSIRFEHNNGKYSGRIQLVGLVRDRAGNLVRRFGGPIQLEFGDQDYNVLKPGTVSFVNHIQLPAGSDYSFELLVKDLLSGMVSNSLETISLKKAEPAFSLSTILLSKEVDKSPNNADHFLTIQGVKILPSARCQFRNGDNLIFYFDIYNPQPDRDKKSSDISIAMSLMRDGQPMNAKLPSYHVNEYSGDPTPHVTFSKFLRLSGLAPGKYTLLVDVKDSLGNQNARGEANFQVVN